MFPPSHYLRPNYGGGIEDKVTSFRRSHARTAALGAPNTLAGHHDPCLHQRLLDTPRQVWVSLLRGHCSFILGPGAHKFLFVPARVYFPVLCKFWQLYGGVNGDLLQEGVCHTQGCCTQSPCHSLLLTGTSTDAQTRFCLSLCGFPGFWCAQGLFEPSKRLWWV